MNMSDTLINSIFTCVSAVISTIITVIPSMKLRKSNEINFERYKKVLFPIMLILEKLKFRYNSQEKATQAIKDIRCILENHRLLAGEKLQQYIYDYEQTEDKKKQKRSFSLMCEYVLSQFNKTAKALGLPIISFSLRNKRFWVNRYSILFWIKFIIRYSMDWVIVFSIVISLLYLLHYIAQKVLPLI